MIVGVPNETYPGEQRVAMVPSVISMLEKLGAEVVMEQAAGESAGFSDDEYSSRGARTGLRREEVFEAADVIIQVRGLGANSDAGRSDLPMLHSEHVLVAPLDPLGNPAAATELARTGVTSFALELLPRISRAQSMDVLSSMATVAGYHATLLAATETHMMWPLMMTAAGTIKPANVLVVGAGVAGLQAIATAHRLGAVVQAYDVRPAAKEQVESLGAKFVELQLETEEAEGSGGYAQAMGEDFYRKQRELMARVVEGCDAVITTAAVPGKKAPILVTEEMVRSMRPGSVVVDLAAETGGNCEVTELGQRKLMGGVTIIGPANLASELPHDASQMFARNVEAFLKNVVEDGALQLDKDDPIVQECMLTRNGAVVNERVNELLSDS